MDFQRALDKNPAPSRVGPVRLRYESNLLIGEVDRALPGFGFPEVTGVGAVATGLWALGLLIFARPPPIGAIALVLGLCALLTLYAVALARRRRMPTRFILSFESEKLRLDAPNWSGKPRTELFSFDDVRALEVLEKDDETYGLLIQLAGGEATMERVLFDGVSEDELEELRRVCRVLSAAFGLPAKP